jgi:putative hydrolase of HD superfamily
MQKVGLKLDDMIRFSRLMLRFQDVVRVVDLPSREQRENDVEHSYHLAMMAWYLNGAGQLGYDTDRVIRYALVHDLAETYAGDVHAFDAKGREGKAEREAAALRRIADELPDSADIIDMAEQYDARNDPEARFVYALDKLMPILMIYLDGGRTWQAEGLTWEMLHRNKVGKVAISEPIQELYEQLSRLLESQPQLFADEPGKWA